MTIRTRRAITGYMFILPFILGFLVFMVRPLLNSFYMSFCDVNPNGLTMEWTGGGNYKYALTADPEYNRLLTEEISRMGINTLATLVLSFVVAVILNGKFKGRTLARAIFFLPVIFSAGVLLGLDSNMLGIEAQNTLMSGISDAVIESGGINLTDSLKNMLQASGIGTRAFQTVFDIIDSVYDIVIASGIQIIVFLSGMQNIPASLYEAAHVEGCSGWESFWKILPHGLPAAAGEYHLYHRRFLHQVQQPGHGEDQRGHVRQLQVRRGLRHVVDLLRRCDRHDRRGLGDHHTGGEKR